MGHAIARESDQSKKITMFGIFKKKSPKAAMSRKYEKLLKEAYELSTVNRQASDAKRAEAERLAEEIEKLEKQQASTA